jgi:hypothetical protein
MGSGMVTWHICSRWILLGHNTLCLNCIQFSQFQHLSHCTIQTHNNIRCFASILCLSSTLVKAYAELRVSFFSESSNSLHTLSPIKRIRFVHLLTFYATYYFQILRTTCWCYSTYPCGVDCYSSNIHFQRSSLALPS